ncbi:uncharacterized protein LOC113521491 [Galleria mellonella]|uniref:Uncharacterized protein LOC113521491 n=1 Tax=Galleria mellonella TaxID=7137 RepID=A0A6J1X174_GALME|nr:uncharacterized protein LOC113521491 [Galleria mellonella]
MSTESVTTLTDLGNDTYSTTESVASTSVWFNESEITSITPLGAKVSITESVRNTIDVKKSFHSESGDTWCLFGAFIIIEIVMTALELIISIVAALKIQRWRRNYRNQMLMQLSIVRFLKRIVLVIIYLKESKIISTGIELETAILSSQTYIDFVIVILVFFFIKHMYDSLIVVLVKISQNNLYKVLICSWLLPLPIAIIFTTLVVTNILNQWLMYLLICCIFKWPLMFMGTVLYLTILHKVLKDKIRQFARSLTIITFLLCLVINFYLFSKDIIELWCGVSFSTLLISYILGFLLNFLILCLYIILITLNFKCNLNSSEVQTNHSVGN